jgi:hypothetical protein
VGWVLLDCGLWGFCAVGCGDVVTWALGLLWCGLGVCCAVGFGIVVLWVCYGVGCGVAVLWAVTHTDTAVPFRTVPFRSAMLSA